MHDLLEGPSIGIVEQIKEAFEGITGCPQKTDHYQSLVSFKECWCNYETLKGALFKKSDMCEQLTKFFVSSTVMLVLGLVCCVCLVIACACMMHYWSGQTRRKLRQAIRVSLIIGPVAVTLGLLQYSIANWDSLSDFGEIVGMIPGASVTPRMTFGYSWMCAVLLTLLTWAPLLLSEHFGKAGMLEEIQEVVHADRKEQMREELDGWQAGGQASQSQQQQQYGAIPPSQFP